MRKIFTVVMFFLATVRVWSQDTLKTSLLDEVVVTGTKYEVPLIRSGKTITKLTSVDLERNAGKNLGDILNEIPGIQMDGNFGTPGSNVSYYLRGGRNKNTLILIDGVPLNDPSAINAEYDLRYIPLSQIESIEVLKGGLATLYGTGAAAGVISIRLKEPQENTAGMIDINAASYKTFAQHAQASATRNKISFLVSGSNITSRGFSAAEDRDESVDFDKDGFSRQNGLLKAAFKFSDRFNIGFQSAYEQFSADYDAYEFTDADNRQRYRQVRAGLTPSWIYDKGEVSAKLFYNVNNRSFESDFPSELRGTNFQGEITHRHLLSEKVQTLTGINFQRLAFEEKNAIGIDSTWFTLFDPYASVLIDLPAGLTVHGGLRLNTHSRYGSKLIYNLNPSFVFNRKAAVRLKVFASIATSYITPSLYQLYSFYGNKELDPESSLNYEAGLSVFSGGKLSFSGVWFRREETQLIDFVAQFDGNGEYTGGQYQNLSSERIVEGIELTADYTISEMLTVGGSFSKLDARKDPGFYKIPSTKFGLQVNSRPFSPLTVSVKYNFTGERETFDFSSFEEVTLDSYQLVDVFGSYGFRNGKFTLYGAVNNLLNEKFVGVFGYTTRARNYSAGIRFKF